MEQPIDNSPSYEELASQCCEMARTIEAIRKALSGNEANAAALVKRQCSKYNKGCPIESCDGVYTVSCVEASALPCGSANTTHVSYVVAEIKESARCERMLANHSIADMMDRWVRQLLA